MENSSSHYNDCFDKVQAISLPSLILLLTFCFLVGVLTVFQNLLVLWVIYRNASLRSNVGFGVSSLAVADLLVGLLGVPVWCIKLSHKAGYIEANVHNLFSCIFTLTLVSSSWSLVGLSYDRFVGVTSPLRYASRVTPTRFVRAIAVIWLLSCLIAIASLMRKCEVSARGHFLFILGIFVLPFLIISYFYFRIFKEAQNQVKLIHVQEVGNTTFRRRENKATMTVALVIGSSALCWLPSLIDAVIHVVAPTFWRETQLYLGATTLACCSSAINPVVYSIRNKPFRDSCFETISSLICWRRRSPTIKPSNNWKVKGIYSQKNAAMYPLSSQEPPVSHSRRRLSTWNKELVLVLSFLGPLVAKRAGRLWGREWTVRSLLFVQQFFASLQIPLWPLWERGRDISKYFKLYVVDLIKASWFYESLLHSSGSLHF